MSIVAPGPAALEALIADLPAKGDPQRILDALLHGVVVVRTLLALRAVAPEVELGAEVPVLGAFGESVDGFLGRGGEWGVDALGGLVYWDGVLFRRRAPPSR